MTADPFDLLRCPHCARDREGRLARIAPDRLRCLERICGRQYPIHDGTPVMLTEAGDFLGFRARIEAETDG